ncbi:WW domain-binding protein 4 isoform X3 [Rhinoraja longicauda]
MADYWKSQPKKFCEYCKCWIADNKPSVEFHERGKNHQENVARKISEIKKKSLDKAKEEERIAKEFAEMENAAMKAYQEDLKRLGLNIPASSSSTTEKKPSVKVSDTQCGTKKSKANVWVKGVSPEGYTYYYDTGTGASQWEKPEGFIASSECSDAACKDKTEPAGSTKEFITEEHFEKNTEDYSPGEEDQLPKDIEASIPQSETIASLQKQNVAGIESDAKSEKTPDTEVEITLPQDEHQQEAKKAFKKKTVNPYGEWEAVRAEEEEQIDLQLPKVEYAAPIVIDVSHEPKVKFKQKEITSLGSDAGGETVFKKRKVENEKTRNFRRKGNDN